MPEPQMDEPRAERENEPEQKTAQKPKRPAPGPKRAEPPGNLRKREQWFRKRAGDQ